jgi:hypothetical protein
MLSGPQVQENGFYFNKPKGSDNERIILDFLKQPRRYCCYFIFGASAVEYRLSYFVVESGRLNGRR